MKIFKIKKNLKKVRKKESKKRIVPIENKYREGK